MNISRSSFSEIPPFLDDYNHFKVKEKILQYYNIDFGQKNTYIHL